MANLHFQMSLAVAQEHLLVQDLWEDGLGCTKSGVSWATLVEQWEIFEQEDVKLNLIND